MASSNESFMIKHLFVCVCATHMYTKPYNVISEPLFEEQIKKKQPKYVINLLFIFLMTVFKAYLRHIVYDLLQRL